MFGTFTLHELEGAVLDIAAWRSSLDGYARYSAMRGLRQVLAAAVRWRFLRANPASATGSNPEPRSEEFVPFTRAEIDQVAAELGRQDAALVVFVAETGLRTNEWTALERRDADRARGVVLVQRRYAEGVLTMFPKTERSRRSVPLTRRAVEALDTLTPRLDSPVLFPAALGGRIDLSAWRARVWYPALDAAGIKQRGPYHLRHTFATEALAAGVSIFNLARIMDTSIQMIDKIYGHLASDSTASIVAQLDARAAQPGVNVASDTPQTQA